MMRRFYSFSCLVSSAENGSILAAPLKQSLIHNSFNHMNDEHNLADHLGLPQSAISAKNHYMRDRPRLSSTPTATVAPSSSTLHDFVANIHCYYSSHHHNIHEKLTKFPSDELVFGILQEHLKSMPAR